MIRQFAYVHGVTGISLLLGKNTEYKIRLQCFLSLWETPGIFIVLSGFATSDLSVDFCDARQGGGAYGKTPAALTWS